MTGFFHSSSSFSSAAVSIGLSLFLAVRSRQHDLDSSWWDVGTRLTAQHPAVHVAVLDDIENFGRRRRRLLDDLVIAGADDHLLAGGFPRTSDVLEAGDGARLVIELFAG